MRRPARSVGRIAHRAELDLCSKITRPGDGSVEVVDLEPQEYPVAERSDVRVAQRTVVVVVDVPAVQLEDELTVAVDQAFVLRTAVVASSAEKMLEPLARGLDVMDCNQRLRSHDVRT